jgi:hypothetical protein
MDATVLLLLVCCWKLTEGSGNMGSDVTGETLTTAMDFLISTTSDQSTLHISFKDTNTVTDSVTIQTFDVTTASTETELELSVHSHQDGETGMATSKYTNTSRGFIEKQRQELYLLNETINNSQKDTVETIWEFIEGNEENVGHLALNKTTQFVQALKEYVNRSKELNIFIDKQNSSADDELKIKEINKVEDRLRGALYTKYQVEYLFTLININVIFKALIDLVQINRKEYQETDNVSLLEDNVTALKDIIQLLNEHIHVAKVLVNFREAFNLSPAFPSDYTDQLVDLKTWESELQNQSRSLVEYNKLLREEKFSLLLQKYINPVTQSVIFIIGCLGNGVLLAVFTMHKDMRTPPNHMVFNLAVGDFLSLINNVLIYDLLDVSGGKWHYGLPLCRFYRFVRHLCLGVTVYSIVVISAQRFFALRVFFRWHGCGCRLTKKYKSVLVIAFVWLLASVVALPRTVNSGVYNNRCLGYGLQDSDGYYRLVNTIDLVALCLVPLAIIAVPSGATARRIIDSVKYMPGETAGKQKVKQARLLSSSILISLVVVFAVCYVPYFLYAFLKAWFTLDVDNSTDLLIDFFTFSLIFANACINPIAVYLASRKYRFHMNKYLLRKCRQQVDKGSRKFSHETSMTAETEM